jgi:alkanesulfonate monooxygenase SsuD/methylene tetrahydromethanopterin reductase-like flavin-dependent oxidoreductase (luciferase family)
MFSLRFDFRLMPDSPATMAELYSGALEMMKWAESRGCIGVTISQHHASPDGYIPSPMIMAAAAAAQTTTLPITVGALLLLMYDPVKLAEDISVLDHLSQGRVNYIIGLGYRPEEYAMFGVEMAGRGKLMEERVDVLHRALTGEVFEWQGRTIDVKPQPLTPDAAMLGYGGGSKAAARRAASRGMLFVPQSGDPALLAAYDEEAEKNGYPTGKYFFMPAGCPNSLFVAEDVDKAWQELGPYLLHDANAYAEWLGGADAVTLSRANSVEALRSENGNYRIVTPQQAVELIQQYGFLALQPLSGGIPPELAWESLRLIDEQVMPLVSSGQ